MLLKRLILAALLIPAPAQSAPPPAGPFAARLSGFIDQLRTVPEAPPGLVVIAIDDKRTLFERAYGVRDVATRDPLKLDTPIYNASVTKAYTGLLAAILDEKGALSLDATLADVWPGVTLPDGRDARSVTLRRMLSHSAGFSNGAIGFRSNTTGQITARQVGDLIARYSLPARTPFEYSNTGPFIYSAAAQLKTGIGWRDLVAREVFRPLGLRRTAARLEAFPAKEVARCHRRTGGGWASVPPKPTALLNAAGGIYASGRDTARFLQAFLTDGRSAGGRVSAAALRRTWQRETDQARQFAGFDRDGYGLGWDLGAYEGRRYVSRAGGYPGCRSFVMWLPEERLGLVVLSTGDAAANALNGTILMQAIDLWTGSAHAELRGGERLAAYRKAAREQAAGTAAELARLASSGPVEPELRAAAAGTYNSARLGQATISSHGEGLRLRTGAYSGEIRRLPDGTYLVIQQGTNENEAFRFSRGAGGRIDGFVWDDDPYTRISAG